MSVILDIVEFKTKTMITKEEATLLKLIRSMNVVKPEPQRKKTRKDYNLQARKDWDLHQAKKNLC